MDRCVVVVINSSQARFFTLEPAEWPEYESGPHLIEQEGLSYSSSSSNFPLWSKIKGKELLNSRSNYPHYKFERKFAQRITSQIINLIRIYQGHKLILVGRPPILNLINKFFTPTIFKNIQIKELYKDISHLNSSKIHQYLAHKELIPACQTVVYPR